MFCLQDKNFIEGTPLSSQTQLSVISHSLGEDSKVVLIANL
jgi:hypothetical protein